MADSSEDTVLITAVNECLKGKFSIKPQQLSAISYILKGIDTLCILPTGFGKSLIYQLLPSLFLKINAENVAETVTSTSTTNPVIVVLSPLLSLIKDQVDSVHQSYLGLNACALDPKIYCEIAGGKYDLIFGTPESWLQCKQWREMLTNDFFSSNLVCIVVEEVHKVSWGQHEKNEKPFREIFAQISIMRSVCRERVPILALSATIDCDLTQLVMESCNLSRNLKIVLSYPDRKNIKLSIVPMKRKNFESIIWILKLLLKEQSIRCIIYCRSVTLVGWIYSKILKWLISNHDPVKATSLIGMFHSMTYDNNKEKVLNFLRQPDAEMKLVVTTSALGCGVNAVNIQYVIHFGPSFDLVDYCQQIGRAGRNTNDQCHAILYTYSQGKSKISNKMKLYIKSDGISCLRSVLYSPFNQEETVTSLSPAHICCSSCSQDCSCGQNSSKIKFPFELIVKHASLVPPKPFRQVSNGQENLVKECLHECRRKSINSVFFTSIDIASGLPDSIIDEIILHFPFIDSINYIENNLSVVDKRVMLEVLQIIYEVFDDI